MPGVRNQYYSVKRKKSLGWRKKKKRKYSHYAKEQEKYHIKKKKNSSGSLGSISCPALVTNIPRSVFYIIVSSKLLFLYMENDNVYSLLRYSEILKSEFQFNALHVIICFHFLLDNRH